MIIAVNFSISAIGKKKPEKKKKSGLQRDPVEALIFFFRLLLSNCLNWKIYCDDHSSLSFLVSLFHLPGAVLYRQDGSDNCLRDGSIRGKLVFCFIYYLKVPCWVLNFLHRAKGLSVNFAHKSKGRSTECGVLNVC